MHKIQSAEADGFTRFRLGGWEVDPATRELRRGEELVRIEPKVMQVLTYPVAHQGQVVTRYDLESSVWAGMVVTDDALTSSVLKLRRALGDSARDPRYIETIARSGYRLVAEIEPLTAPDPTDRPPVPVVVEPGLSTSHTLATPASLAAGAAVNGFSGASMARRTTVLVLFLATILAMAWWLAPRSSIKLTADGSGLPVVAVLPFANLSGDARQDYFANGMTQDLITELSKLSGLQVVAQHSSLVYSGSAISERHTADAFGARFIVRGSVQRAGDRLRINVNLVEASDGRHRWGERYDRRLTDVFRVQDEIVRHVVSTLRVEVAPAGRWRFENRYIAGIDAYDTFLRGLDLLGRRSLADNPEARVYFEQAIAFDPGFARAYAGLAMTYAQRAVYGHGPSVAGALNKAEEIARQGLAIADSVPQLHYAMRLVDMYRGDLAAAIASVSRAIEVRPSYADGYGLLAWILHFAGRPDEGLVAMRKAIALNPSNPALYHTVNAALRYEMGNLSEALRLLEQSLAMNPDQILTRIYLAAVYSALGQQEAAEWQADEISSLAPDFTLDLSFGFPIRDPGYRERFLADLARVGLIRE
ncbi:MAG: winged helix-turn-helix domain-containing protein [Sedimenticolaceae bacterium]